MKNLNRSITDLRTIVQEFGPCSDLHTELDRASTKLLTIGHVILMTRVFPHFGTTGTAKELNETNKGDSLTNNQELDTLRD